MVWLSFCKSAFNAHDAPLHILTTKSAYATEVLMQFRMIPEEEADRSFVTLAADAGAFNAAEDATLRTAQVVAVAVENGVRVEQMEFEQVHNVF